MGHCHRCDSSAAGPGVLNHIVPHFPVLVREQLSQLLALLVVESIDFSHLIGSLRTCLKSIQKTKGVIK